MKDKQKALALGYDRNTDDAPVVKAKGAGSTAEAILRIARENSIPVVEDPALEALFSGIPVGSELPPELFEVAAHLLAFVYAMKKGR